MSSDKQDCGIAIIGMSGRFPGAANIEQYWQMLCEGKEGISFFTAEELLEVGIAPKLVNNPSYVRARGMLPDIERFDARFFGYSRRDAEIMDPQQRFFLECCWEAMETAGYAPGSSNESIGVFAGSVSGNTYLLQNLLGNSELRENIGDYGLHIANDKDGLTTRVAYKLNLRGPAVTIQTACSTSLVAIATACQSLLDYQCDLALAGGVAITTPQKAGYLYTPGLVVSSDGHCRPFDARSEGTLTSSGIGVVLLKRVEEAIRDRDSIVSVIRGWAINNDGAEKVGYTAPSVRGQADCITQALELAGVDADSIGMVEAHGTGTPVGDPIEVAALTQAFRQSTPRRGFCALGSVKSNVGHLETAAGVAGLIKAAKAVAHGLIPPSLHFETPNPELDLPNSPFFVNTTLRPFPKSATPRRAGVSSFGIGGTNAHVVVEEPPSVGPTDAGRPAQLLLLSARSAAALEQMSKQLADHLAERHELSIADVAFTLQLGRRGLPHRRTVLCTDRQDAVAALRQHDAKRTQSAEIPARAPGVIFMFSGQGSQYVGMCHELYVREPAFRAPFDLCCDHFRAELGLDLRTILFPKEADRARAEQRLIQTAVTQPALFSVEYALAKFWMSLGVTPVAMIGHSLGELVAACIAQVMSLRDAVTLVAQRGTLMQSMPPGAMLAVPLPEAQVRNLLTPDLSLSAVNGPSHCVVAGPVSAIDDLEKRLSAEQLRGRRLQTSHAFHSKMMEPMLQPFLEKVRRIKLNPPQLRYISNVTGKWIKNEEATDPSYYAEQIRRAVLFSPGMECLLAEHDRVLLEIGPGSTLGILAKQHPDPTARRVIVSSLRGPSGTHTDTGSILSAIGGLWLAGIPIDWSALYKEEKRKRVPLPTYPFERERFWVDPVQKAVEVSSPSRPRVDTQTKDADVDGALYQPAWRQTEPVIAEPSNDPKNWLVFVSPHPLCQSVVRRLRLHGQAVTTVRVGSDFGHDHLDEYAIAPGSLDAYLRLVEELHRLGRSPRHIVHMWNIGGDDERITVRQIDSAQQLTYLSLVKLARALGTHIVNDAVELDVITSAAFKVHGDDQWVRPDRALVSGPCKVIPQEYRNVTTRHIDLSLSAIKQTELEALADHVTRELGSPQTDPVIAYRGPCRYVLYYRPLRIPKPTGELVRLRPGGAYLITGGLGGIGLVLAEYLARSCKAKLILISRNGLTGSASASQSGDKNDGRTTSSSSQYHRYGSGLWEQSMRPDNEDDAAQSLKRKVRKVENLQRLGAEVMVVRADVADLDGMRTAVESAVARFGPIRGVIHAAGVPSGGVIQRRSRDAALSVLQPKVTGTLVLDEIFQERDLDFFVLCSSLNAIVGGFGQADYSAANAFQDAFAHHRSQRSRGLTTSINWDAWREVGMAVKAARTRRRSDDHTPSQYTASSSQYRDLGHPLFDRFIVDERGAAIYSTKLVGHKRWVLSEHRVSGRQTLPGTAYLELARAAYESHIAQVQPVELRDVSFRTPMTVADDSEPEIRTVLRATGKGDECEFEIESRGSPERRWQTHASGRIATIGTSPVVRHDIERFVREAPQVVNLDEQTIGAKQRPMEFGPRWRNLHNARFGRSCGLALVQHPDVFASDLDVFMLHPAVLDSATGFVASRSTAHFLPFGYRRVRVIRPLQSSVYAYAVFEPHSEGGRERLHIQVTVMDTDGVVLLEIEDYVLVKVSP